MNKVIKIKTAFILACLLPIFSMGKSKINELKTKDKKEIIKQFKKAQISLANENDNKTSKNNQAIIDDSLNMYLNNPSKLDKYTIDSLKKTLISEGKELEKLSSEFYKKMEKIIIENPKILPLMKLDMKYVAKSNLSLKDWDLYAEALVYGATAYEIKEQVMKDVLKIIKLYEKNEDLTKAKAVLATSIYYMGKFKKRYLIDKSYLKLIEKNKRKIRKKIFGEQYQNVEKSPKVNDNISNDNK